MDIEEIKILIVEDNQVYAKLLVRLIIKEWGIKEDLLKLTCSAEEAIALLESGYLPHCAIFDVRLPGITGIELLKTIQLNPKWKRIRVMVLSSSSITTEAIASIDSGAAIYVVKPHELLDLNKIIKALKEIIESAIL